MRSAMTFALVALVSASVTSGASPVDAAGARLHTEDWVIHCHRDVRHRA